MNLEVIKKSCSLYHMDENREIPSKLYRSGFFSATRTDSGLTIICDSDIDFSCKASLVDLKLIRVKDNLDVEVAGIINSVAESLAKENISILLVSTFENFYIAVKESVLDQAVSAFKKNGYEVYFQ